MTWLALLACGGTAAPPFDADVVVVAERNAIPPMARYVVDVTVANDGDASRWVLLPSRLQDQAAASFSVVQVTLFDDPSSLEYHIFAEDGRGWIAWPLAPGERRTHRTEVSTWNRDVDRLELWLVADVRFAGGPTLSGVSSGELAPPEHGARPETDAVMHRVLKSWKAPHRGWAVFDEGERREVVFRRP